MFEGKKEYQVKGGSIVSIGGKLPYYLEAPVDKLLNFLVALSDQKNIDNFWIYKKQARQSLTQLAWLVIVDSYFCSSSSAFIDFLNLKKKKREIKGKSRGNPYFAIFGSFKQCLVL